MEEEDEFKVLNLEANISFCFRVGAAEEKVHARPRYVYAF